MASAWYTSGKTDIIAGTINLTSDTIKVMLVDSTYSFSAAHDFADDVDAKEISVSGYTGGFNGAGRKTLASKTFTAGVFDAADVTWTALAAGVTIGGAVILKEITNDAASRLIAFIDSTDLATNGNDVTAVWNASGLIGF